MALYQINFRFKFYI